ncbi:UNVERIFIED_CONTAM: hypothetical protein Sangu_2580000 [Sesamum angustifolium]|uniref:Uncharacterized protein n=1 Tax=Sesamum angustifolium TaxID=2727405 RepID=A0AAW2J7N0_9LAMI
MTKGFYLAKYSALGKGFQADTRREELLLEESSEATPQTDAVTSFAPIVPTNDIHILRRSTRVSQQPERYGFFGLTGQLDNDPKTYGEAMSNIDSGKWIEAIKFEMDSMSLNKVWTLVDPPKGVRPVGCKWVYKWSLWGGYYLQGQSCGKRMDNKTATLIGLFRKRSIWISRKVSHLLEKSRRSAISKGPFMVSNKFPEAGIFVLMRSYGVMISSRMTLTLVYTRRSVGA